MFVAIGFDSIAIALLARANPFAIILTSILWGSMLSGAGLMQQEAGLSIDAVRIVQALVLLFVAADVIVRAIFRMKREGGAGARWPQTQVGHRVGCHVNGLRFGRLQTLGVLFGLLGVFLIGYVAPNLDAADKGFAFEPPPEPLKVVFSPSTIVTAIGIIFVLTAVATFFERRSERLASGSLLLPRSSFIPLVLVLALALSTAPDTNITQLLVESLRLGTPDRARGHVRAVVRALRRRQHRHRGHDAGVGRHRVHDLCAHRRRAGHRRALALRRRRGPHRRPHLPPARRAQRQPPGEPDHLGCGHQPARARA